VRPEVNPISGIRSTYRFAMVNRGGQFRTQWKAKREKPRSVAKGAKMGGAERL
jgi:hypothetical protein